MFVGLEIGHGAGVSVIVAPVVEATVVGAAVFDAFVVGHSTGERMVGVEIGIGADIMGAAVVGQSTGWGLVGAEVSTWVGFGVIGVPVV